LGAASVGLVMSNRRALIGGAEQHLSGADDRQANETERSLAQCPGHGRPYLILTTPRRGACCGRAVEPRPPISDLQ
jgi:hypothetical protein